MNDQYLIKIDDPRIQETYDAYFKWKDLNTYVESLVSRGIKENTSIKNGNSRRLSKGRVLSTLLL